MDSTAANLIESAIRKAEKTGADVIIAGAQPGVRASLESHEVHEPRVRFTADAETALALIDRDHRSGSAAGDARPLEATA